jgi:hypothetical protein
LTQPEAAVGELQGLALDLLLDVPIRWFPTQGPFQFR